MSADSEAIEFARKNLDLSKNLNDQGYFGPLPNDADPRPYKPGRNDLSEVEYYEWAEKWIENHGSIDNAQMLKDRMSYLCSKPGFRISNCSI